TQLLDIVRNVLPEKASCVYIRQSEALGLGHAVLCAKQVVGDDPFAVILADDLISGSPSTLEQMTKLYDEHQSSIIGVQNVPREERRCSGRSRCWRTSSRASGTIAAASSATCRRRSSTRSSIPS